MMAARQDTANAQQAQLQAEAHAAREKERADAAVAQAQAEREARERAEADAKIAREQAADATVVVVPQTTSTVTQQTIQAITQDAGAKQVRAQFLRQMNMAIVTRDTPRGLDATLDDADFDRGQLRSGPANAVSRLAALLTAHPDLRVSIEGNSDTVEGSALAGQRAESVAAALRSAGVPAARISSQTLGNSRLLVSNATEQGRMENRRVEIVITGDSIGSVPSWDRTYPLSFSRN